MGPGEKLILYTQKGKVKHGKVQETIFFKKQWMDENRQDRDPHACLKKGDDCGVCHDPALKNGSKIKKHRRMRVGEKCSVCKNTLNLNGLNSLSSLKTRDRE